MNKYGSRTEKKKKDIIYTALSLFKEKGFMAVSIREIAALARVSQVSIYNYFGSKDALVSECVQIIMQPTREEAASILNEEIEYSSKWKKVLNLCSSSIHSLFPELFSKTALEDNIMQNLLLENILKEKLAIYQEFIELGKKEGYINPVLSTRAICSLIEGINEISEYNESFGANEDFNSQIQHLFLFGIIGR